MSPADAVALAQGIEKLSIIGVLVLLSALLFIVAAHFRKELTKAHERRETEVSVCQREINGLRDDLNKLKTMFLVVRGAADRAGANYKDELHSVGDLEALLRRDP
jgi:hypothetical protein